MPRTERIRRTIIGEFDFNELEQFQKQGWKLVAVEWERELTGDEPATAFERTIEKPPFGTRVRDASTLESDPSETEVLLAMMELLIQDGPYSFIAQELNRRGYRTRQGSAWTPVSVFQMLPRLIEAGPSIFSTEEWRHRRHQALRHVPQRPI
jgi:Recombinase